MPKTVSFKRGIHPPGCKDTAYESIKIILPKKGALMYFPMVQHIGAPCEPLVSAGETVMLGQKIGDSAAYVSSPVHASVSGLVREVRPVLTPGGIVSTAVCIENDDLYTEDPSINRPVDHKSLSRDEMLKLIREAGIVGLGGAGFPTHVKLSPPAEKPIDTLLVNAAECEPYLTTDHRVLLEETDRILRGLEILLGLFPGAKGIIAIETNKKDAIEKIMAENKNPGISVTGMVPKYPQGAEKQLIKACVGREVPSGGLPADIGCIVHNVDTVIAVHRAVYRGRPLMRKVITVAGGAVKKPGNFKIRLGMTYKDMMEAAGGFNSEPYKMVSGGPMMGVSMYTLDVPVIKTSSAFLALTEKEGKLPPECNCIRCGKCVKFCPIGLMPLDLNRFVTNGEQNRFLEYNGLDCIECGSCSYVCPSKRHLAQSVRTMRRDVMAQRSKNT